MICDQRFQAADFGVNSDDFNEQLGSNHTVKSARLFAKRAFVLRNRCFVLLKRCRKTMAAGAIGACHEI